ncbi:MAG: PEGA domain-containing protein, partial [Acidobacteria bacterium]|nr:PEGA domain-containing protein [Acidobacteriota bacterium]
MDPDGRAAGCFRIDIRRSMGAGFHGEQGGPRVPAVSVRQIAVLVYLLLAAPSLALGVASQQEQDTQPSLQRAIELIEDGDFAAAASILETITAGPADRENVSSEPRDMVLAYLYLGIARMYLSGENDAVAGEDDAREAFQDAQRLDPTFQPEEVPRRVMDVWEEVRDLGAVVVVTVPEGAAVYVDGEMRGNSPVDLAMLPPGEYRITVTTDGYVDGSRVVAVAPGSDETLRFELTPTRAQPAAGQDATVAEAEAAEAGVQVETPVDRGRDGRGTAGDAGAVATADGGLGTGALVGILGGAGAAAGVGLAVAGDDSTPPVPEPIIPTGPDGRAVLIEFYNATNGANWTNSANWNSSEPLGAWHGVATDGNGRVRRLDLFGNQLTGSIPSSLGSLTNLEYLHLGGNQLTGSIPSSLGSLTNLE